MLQNILAYEILFGKTNAYKAEVFKKCILSNYAALLCGYGHLQCKQLLLPVQTAIALKFCLCTAHNNISQLYLYKQKHD